MRVGQQHALCTYKDPDLPVTERFRRALELLDAVDRFDMDVAQRQESLGLRGAVYKRKWQIEGQRSDLVRARGCYQQGYELGPATDHGYTGINAAFVIDVMAREEAAEARRAQGDWRYAETLWQRAE